MEWIVISDSKLKVMLSAEDMRAYEFDDVNSTHTKEAFRSLMQEARAHCGFDGLDGRVFVQLYRSKAGGGELFVTKLSKGEPGSGAESRHGDSERTERREEDMSTEYQRYYKEKPLKNRHVIYRFDEMGHLLSICGVLLSSGYSGGSAAYCEKGRSAFYLTLDEETRVAGEYFGKLCPGSFYCYINEHCERFCGNAVPILGKLA